MRSKPEARVLDAAIEAVAEHGFEGTSARDIAKKLGSTTMPLYHSFENKENLFGETLKEVISGSFNPSQLLLLFYKAEGPRGSRSLLHSVLLCWYRSLPKSSARVLMFAFLSQNEEWRTAAHVAIEELIGILSTAIRHGITTKRRHKGTTETNIAAQALILLLLQLKATGYESPSQRQKKEESKNVVSLLGYLVRGLGSPASG